MIEPVRISVCVCTFRRDSLAATLRSIAAQKYPDIFDISVVVADNDVTPSARDLCDQIGAETGLDLTYVHAPAGNISIARNATLTSATGDWLAFIDDDEVASEHWLASLYSAATQEELDIVLGPVRPILPSEAPEWMRDGRFHETLPTERDGKVLAGYTSNALVRASLIRENGLGFDLALGQTGGEDTVFFDALLDMGAKIGMCSDAYLTEEVPSDRARLGWLIKRRFRSGQTHGLILGRKSKNVLARFRHILLALAKAAVSMLGFLVTSLSAERRAFWILRTSLHLGVVARLLGHREIVQYGQMDPGR